MRNNSQVETLQHIKQGFQGLGYIGGLLQEEYEFADVLSSEHPVRSIPLAAFAQEPPSYRNASFGVAIANGRTGPAFIQDHRSLGAPQILEITDDSVLRWKISGTGMPSLLEELAPSRLPDLFLRHKDEWSPRQVLRAKSGGEIATQLDFIDVNLLPALEFEVRSKLDTLLRDTISLSIDTFERKSPFSKESYPPLFRLIFRLIAAKVLADRHHPGDWTVDDPQQVVKSVEEFYFRGSTSEPVLNDLQTQAAGWERIRTAFHFQNLSVDSLAYVYENTLVTPETRKLFGIHSTPPAIAEYIVKRLPFDVLETNERRVFEPFSGHSVFLVAAMQRLRELLPPAMNPIQRHEYFVKMLAGIEIDDFAREVARLSLMLADYPNPDGWRLHGGDALTSTVFDQELAQANIVLCNPPFEAFSQDDRSRYGELFSVLQPAEVLHRVLASPPYLLGFVLPRAFMAGRSYRELRSRLGSTYSSIDLLALPDKVFEHSEAETVLLLCSGQRDGAVHLKTGEVYKDHLRSFYTTHKPSYEIEDYVREPEEQFKRSMWLPPLQEVWETTATMKKLGQVSDIHRGIEYNRRLGKSEATFVSDQAQEGFVRGLHRVKGSTEPFVVLRPTYLNFSNDVMRTNAYKLPWGSPKLIVNARRRSRGFWRIAAAQDNSGLVCYQNFHAVWPNAELPLEVVAAVLNGPLANAFASTRELNRDVYVETLREIPIPEFEQAQQQIISSLVQKYCEARTWWLAGQLEKSESHERCSELLNAIDAEVLKAYDLSPRVERELLDWFRGHVRPGPVEFTEYFPSTFKPYIPWHIYTSAGFKLASARDTLKRMPVIPESPPITEALSYMG
jgi:hypothetical protein